MTDTVDTTPAAADKTSDVEVSDRMSTNFIDYAMSVIVGRALPDARDGLKPVQRRVVYGMYDSGYRADRGYFKCARIIGDVMGNYHPHGDSSIYDALVRMAQPWSLSEPLVDGQGNFGSQGNDPAAAHRYTEARMSPLAMELVRDIDEDTVPFRPNYDGKTQEPDVLPARFPNLLVNGSEGIAVGMATRIPPHNLGEVGKAALWLLNNPDADDETLLDAAMQHITGPDFPTGALILGRTGIEDTYRTGHGSILMRAVTVIETDARGRSQIVVTDLPYQVNKDTLLESIVALANTGKVSGIADVNDEGSARIGLRLTITLKRDAVPSVVLNNLFKHTKLQTAFSSNMLAIVGGVPTTLTLPSMLRVWADHQVDVVVRRATFRKRRAQERDHILQGLLKALDQIDAVIALIRASQSTDEARTALMALLAVDEIQANAILDMQLRRLAALEAGKIVAEHNEITALIGRLQAVIDDPAVQRNLIAEELQAILDKFPRARRTQIVPFGGDLDDEDLIPREDMVITITRGGYAKRTRTDQYREQKRGGKGVRGVGLRNDDLVEHLLITTSHHTLMFFTSAGRVYRSKVYNLVEGGRDAKGQHLANVLGMEPGETVAQVLAIDGYDAAHSLVLTTRNGLVKKTPLTDYNTRISGGLIAVSLRDGDELVAAGLVTAADDLLVVSRKGQAIRFHCTDDQVRPTGRNTSGVTAMRFRDDDTAMTALVIPAAQDIEILVATSGGYAKRSAAHDYPVRNRGGLGVQVAKTDEGRGDVIGALVVDDNTSLYALTSRGGVIRTRVADVRVTARTTLGVKLIDLGKNDTVLYIAGADDDTSDADEADDVVADDGAAAVVPAAPADDDQTSDEATAAQ